MRRVAISEPTEELLLQELERTDLQSAAVPPKMMLFKLFKLDCPCCDSSSSIHAPLNFQNVSVLCKPYGSCWPY